MKDKDIIIKTIPKIIVMMLITAYLSGFVKTSYDYFIVMPITLFVGIFLFFIDHKKLLSHIKK